MKVLTAAIPLYFAQAASALLPIVIAPVIVRSSGLDVFGQFSSVLVAMQIGLIISEYSFDLIGPRLVAAAGERQSAGSMKVYASILIAKIPLGLLGAIAAALVAAVLLRRIPTCVEIASIAMVVSGTAMYASWFHIAIGQTTRLAFLIATGRLATFIWIILFIWEYGEIAPDVALVAYSLPWFLVGALIFVANHRSFESVSWLNSVRLLRTGWIAYLGIAAGALQNILGTLLSGLFYGSEALGVVTAIDRLAKLVTAVLKPVFQVLYPKMVRLHRDNMRVASALVWRCVRWCFGMSLVAMLLACWKGGAALMFIYGEGFGDQRNILVVIVAWLAIGIQNNLVGIQGLLAAGQDRGYTKGILAGTVIALVGGVLSGALDLGLASILGSVILGELFAFGKFTRIYKSVSQR